MYLRIVDEEINLAELVATKVQDPQFAKIFNPLHSRQLIVGEVEFLEVFHSAQSGQLSYHIVIEADTLQQR